MKCVASANGGKCERYVSVRWQLEDMQFSPFCSLDRIYVPAGDEPSQTGRFGPNSQTFGYKFILEGVRST